MKSPLISKPSTIFWSLALAASFFSFSGCAGSKMKSGSNGSPNSEATGADNGDASKRQMVEDALRSAEETELVAHKLRAQMYKRSSHSSSN